MGAASSKPDEKVFENETPISFSPDIVNHLSDRLESTETTPERQTILDAHIRSRIRNELEHLKKDEEDVRREIESALEKENLDHERAMAGEASEADGSSVGDVRSSAALLGDLEDIKVKIEKHQARKEDAAFQEVQTFAQAVTDCYRNNTTTSLNCWSQVRNFKSAVDALEREHFKSI